MAHALQHHLVEVGLSCIHLQLPCLSESCEEEGPSCVAIACQSLVRRRAPHKTLTGAMKACDRLAGSLL